MRRRPRVGERCEQARRRGSLPGRHQCEPASRSWPHSRHYWSPPHPGTARPRPRRRAGSAITPSPRSASVPIGDVRATILTLVTGAGCAQRERGHGHGAGACIRVSPAPAFPSTSHHANTAKGNRERYGYPRAAPCRQRDRAARLAGWICATNMTSRCAVPASARQREAAPGMTS